MSASRWVKATLVASTAVAAMILTVPAPTLAEDAKGIVFGRLNDKAMGDSWGGKGKLYLIVGKKDDNKKNTDMCPNGYAAMEVDAGLVRPDVVKLPKGSSDGFVDRSEAYLNQPSLNVKPNTAVYWGDVKLSYDYGSLIFKSQDKAEAAKAATIACLKAMGNTALADKLAKAPVEKQLVFVDMNKR